ncbi:Oxidoreductase family, NAD-binding Rossmann fold protein [Synechococcus sp. PCC 7335]|uniref:Gfo/Idh/MocA family protein n=1 Tax=Synechococcus sp. (strain ATCC 29403 / PCC 7335) TaxID=91464 RepID=UPI00017EBB9F|nr:Gfo/Idh/MocA family oxidoreductase [Synechococcus sp. PCC 7335]EDX84001.1 Oxidoreductase family, NAD-binding Rossmann fold protein [Synechococcus sp. PCC 7335]
MSVIRVGLVGTGYAASARAKAFLADERSHLVGVSGSGVSENSTERTAQFANQYGMQAIAYWQQLIADESIDLVVVCTISSLHGEVVKAALEADKHVVVEYPLSFDVQQAEQLVKLAAQKQLLLHVEHIELLGGLHLAMRSNLSKVGKPSYVGYRTINPQTPAPKKWTYQKALFGFPFCGALSRVHRLTNLFGRVNQVNCQTRIVEDAEDIYFRQMLSSGRLQFESGLIAELVYGKGEGLMVYHREIEVQGEQGKLFFDRNEGMLMTAQGTSVIAIEPRRGLFVKDTQGILDNLTEGTPLYVSAAESVYALRVGDALRRASDTGESVVVI